MNAINKIQAYYNHKVEADSESSAQRITDLKLQHEELNVVIGSTDPENAIQDIINGESALNVIAKVQGHEIYTNAALLVEAAIDTLVTQEQQLANNVANALSQVNTAYHATLRLKETIISRHTKNEPITDVVKSQFAAQFGALISSLSDCPDNLIKELRAEIEEVPKVQSFGDLVN